MAFSLINFEKFKTFKNYISLNLMSSVGYISFLNALITLFVAKPILNDTSNLDEMFWGVEYNLYTVKVVLIQIAIAAVFYGLYKFERFLLKKQEKENYINPNNIIFKIIFYTGFILFFLPFLIFNKAVILILIFLLDALFDLLGLSHFKFYNNFLIIIKEHSFIVLCLLIYIFIKIKPNKN